MASEHNFAVRRVEEEDKMEDHEGPTELITVYYSSVAGNKDMNKAQFEIESTLRACRINFELKDVAASFRDRIRMRSFANDTTALPPQIVNGYQYCGGYEEFVLAMEKKSLAEFLKLDRKIDQSI
eukprot:gene245-862_t